MATRVRLPRISQLFSSLSSSSFTNVVFSMLSKEIERTILDFLYFLFFFMGFVSAVRIESSLLNYGFF